VKLRLPEAQRLGSASRVVGPSSARGGLTRGRVRSEFQPGERTRVAALGGPVARQARARTLVQRDGSPTVRVTSLQRVSERVRTAEGAVVELAEELTRLARLVSHGPEARAQRRNGAPEVRK
jgi:hypothetical protein